MSTFDPTIKERLVDEYEEDPTGMFMEMDADELREHLTDIYLADKDPEDQLDYGGCVRDARWKQINRIAERVAVREVTES